MDPDDAASAPEGVVEEGAAPFVEPLLGPWSRVALGLVLLVVVAFALVAVAMGWVSVADVRSWVQAQGVWAPLLFLVLFVVAAVLVLPGTAMIVLAALLFPLGVAFFLAWLGAVLGSSAAFMMARLFGRRFVARLMGDRMARLDDRVAEHGFQVVLLLRLAGVPPYNLLNYASGLTRVRFVDHLAGTALGVLPLVAAVVAIVHRIGTAPSFMDIVTDPVLYGVLGLVVLLVGVTRRLKRRTMGAMPEDVPGAP